jgi:hypothetical protein
MSEGFLPVPVTWADDVEHRRLLANGVNSLRDGKINATGSATLAASATSTAVTDVRVGADSVLLLMPTTANAAGALATTYIGTVAKQSFTISHANNSQTDRTFKYAILG